MEQIKEKLEYLRGELRAETISYGEIAELQTLAEHIEKGDTELLEAAGVPETENKMTIDIDTIKGKTIEEVKALGLDFDTAYPVVEGGIVTGIVDGNYPLEYNEGKWEIIDDYYAQATE